METPARSWVSGPGTYPRRASRMSSSGHPENNDQSRRQGFEVRVRRPAGGASRWQLLRAACRDRLRLSGSQRHVLAAIQNELQADTELVAAFSLFTSATSSAAMPRIERLPTWRTLAGWRAGCRALLNWRIMLVVAVLAPLAAVAALALTASPPGGAADSLRACPCARARVPCDVQGSGQRGRAASARSRPPAQAACLRPP
jgi:hypothetical protein